MVRYLALAFIFFQVATTAALATQEVLFANDTPLTSAALTPPVLPPARETAGRPEGRQIEHLLIQIDPGKQSQASPVND
ncbi:hypothetical protein [Mesorhizobium sp. WSM4904]|uniref:hypothetical protein n=1 Tax=Mesorhizobium sp. WSM4904 TaxID=3038545 RepID=UPI0024186591|nr:hypothetical protein [Mesorhizobium sp. WSM4904]WFP61855.1 hypothetical protein QAZ47_25810 [Mesorhizobium sp. WSM4904]